VSPTSSPGWTLEQDLALYRELHLTSVSTSAGKLSVASTDRWRTMLAEHGMRLNTVSLDVGGRFDLTRPATWPACQDAYVHSLHTAAELGATQCIVGSGSGHGHPWRVSVQAFADAVAPVLEAAADLGLRLLVEPVRPQFGNVGFVHCLADGIRLARDLGLGLSVDITHCWWDSNLGGLIRDNVDLVGVVKLADLRFGGPVLDRVNLGDGELPVAEIVGMFVGAGYDGDFVIELAGAAVIHEGCEIPIRRACAYLSQLQPFITYDRRSP
jgi:sugar phosphate isomerase/epimerase